LVPPLHSLDSGFRRNDELRGRHEEGMPQITDERLLELSILLPMTMRDGGSTNCRAGFATAGDELQRY
jgi:hypothetical protein